MKSFQRAKLTFWSINYIPRGHHVKDRKNIPIEHHEVICWLKLSSSVCSKMSQVSWNETAPFWVQFQKHKQLDNFFSSSPAKHLPTLQHFLGTITVQLRNISYHTYTSRLGLISQGEKIWMWRAIDLWDMETLSINLASSWASRKKPLSYKHLTIISVIIRLKDSLTHNEDFWWDESRETKEISTYIEIPLLPPIWRNKLSFFLHGEHFIFMDK